MKPSGITGPETHAALTGAQAGAQGPTSAGGSDNSDRLTERLGLTTWLEASDESASESTDASSLDGKQRHAQITARGSLSQPAASLQYPPQHVIFRTNAQSALGDGVGDSLGGLSGSVSGRALAGAAPELSPPAQRFSERLPKAAQKALSEYRTAKREGSSAEQLKANRQALQCVHQAVDVHLAEHFDMHRQIERLKRTAFLDETSAVLLECTRLLEADAVSLVTQLRADENWSALFDHLPAADHAQARETVLSLESYVTREPSRTPLAGRQSPFKPGLAPDSMKTLKAHFVDMIVNSDALTELQDLLSYQTALAPQPLMQFTQGVGADGLSVEPLTAAGEVDNYNFSLASVNSVSLQRADSAGRPLGCAFRVSIPRSYSKLNQQPVGLYRNEQGGLTTAGTHGLSMYHEIVGHGLDIVRGELPNEPLDGGWTGEWEVSAIARENTKRSALGFLPRGAHEAFRAALPIRGADWQQRHSANFFQSTAKALVGHQPTLAEASADDEIPKPLSMASMRRTVTNSFAF